MLENMIQREKPILVFLQETKSNSTLLEKFFNKVWTGCHSVFVDASGTFGGLEILWNPQILSLQDFHASHFFIQANFHLTVTNIHGLLTNVYFPQDLQKKLDLLNTLSTLSSSRCHPLWISGGEFIIITALEEKSGGLARLEGDNIGFKDFISRNQLMDLQTSNGMFTWTNKRRGSQHIDSRLDRFLLSDNAIHLGRDFHASILLQASSDHWPLMLQWSRPESKSNRPF